MLKLTLFNPSDPACPHTWVNHELVLTITEKFGNGTIVTLLHADDLHVKEKGATVAAMVDEKFELRKKK